MVEEQLVDDGRKQNHNVHVAVYISRLKRSFNIFEMMTSLFQIVKMIDTVIADHHLY